MKNPEKKNSCPNCGKAIPMDAPQDLCPECLLSGVATEGGPNHPTLVHSDFPTQEEVARAFPGLEILELLGQGGMGIVYKARQPHLDRVIALKLLPPKLGADPQFAERFSREARMLARLNHPNIVAVYDFGHVEALYYLMMEHVDGVNLREAMQAGRFSPGEALKIVPKICEALQFAHEQKILHRDIKPENVLMDTHGNVKIADFGIAKLTGDPSKNSPTLTSMGQTLGTPHYMAPEQIENPTDVDHRADIYSLGVVLYEMLTGELPIGRFDVPSTKTQVSPTIDEIVLRALEKDRERRQPTANRFRTEVEEAKESSEENTKDRAKVTRDQSQTKVTPARWSYKSIIASVLSAASCFFISFTVLVLALRDDNIFAAILTPLFPAILLGGIGSIVGWIGISEIRQSRGGLLGLPLGVFGALELPIIALVSIIIGIPYLIAARTDSPTLLSPFSWIVLGVTAFLLSIAIIVMTFRWATGQKAWGPLTRWQKISIGVLIAGFILMLYPFRRDTNTSSESPAPTVTPTSLKARSAQGESVEINVSDVKIETHNGTRRIVFVYTRTENGGTIDWNTSGSFPNFANSLSQAGRIRSRPDGSYEPTEHTVALDLPPSIAETAQQALLTRTQAAWKGQSLQVFPGDIIPILTIPQASEDDVVLTLVGRTE